MTEHSTWCRLRWRHCHICTCDQTPAAADADAMELAYGLLWLVPVDTHTKTGLCVSLARKALLGQLDRDAKLRGLKAAQDLLDPNVCGRLAETR